ncbi:PREDICTED: contactin-4-like [Amphimedon queenslandica]|uniref:Ig-like domain-containing protein n=2 Tax=Amphimedon queenslandica TaxID=400682 RepID=A0AAN0J3Y0_AMPQE|nr:PREDICTED: contactin-4-like [Amphimedon queenslandica]|eukprot:XP_019851724.1 PREDICTED: contactin-4-like [Amphimedon queenslandica]
MLTSVLIVPNARVSDSGLYYCVARFTDGTNSSQSNESFVNITGGIRIIYFPQENNSISIIISSLLLFISSPSFRIQCKGSGDITWINPNGEPVTFNNTSTPHQSSNGILNFTQSPTNGELYTCLSDTGASDSVFVTIDNPAIYTSNSSILIKSSTIIMTATIRVYVDGLDPPPTPNNITWHHNEQLIHNTSSYMLTSNNTVLAITGQGSSLIGSYTIRVRTINGDSSVTVNVTYPDAPTITIDGPDIIREGDNVSLHCNITSSLPVNNISWYFATSSSTETLLQLQEPLLMIVNARRDSSGFYICSVTDDVRTTNQSIEIHIQYMDTISSIMSDAPSPTEELSHSPTNTSSLTEALSYAPTDTPSLTSTTVTTASTAVIIPVVLLSTSTIVIIVIITVSIAVYAKRKNKKRAFSSEHISTIPNAAYEDINKLNININPAYGETTIQQNDVTYEEIQI